MEIRFAPRINGLHPRQIGQQAHRLKMATATKTTTTRKSNRTRSRAPLSSAVGAAPSVTNPAFNAKKRARADSDGNREDPVDAEDEDEVERDLDQEEEGPEAAGGGNDEENGLDESDAPTSESSDDASEDEFRLNKSQKPPPPKTQTPKSKNVKTPKKKAAKRSKTSVRAKSGRSRDVESVDEELGDDLQKLQTPNFLYDAILDPESSIDTLVSDFFDSFALDAIPALTDLINFVLKLCGITRVITAYDIEDTDSVSETLMQLQDKLKNTTGDSYPLISKAKELRGLRKQLQVFWQAFVSRAAENDTLFEGPLLETLETWIQSMSSSSFRAFRHTATTISLIIMTCLVDLSATLIKEIATSSKTLELELKKKTKNTSRIKSIEMTIDSKQLQNGSLKEIIDNFFDSVFVHRYRDVDPRIRSESIKELGHWMVQLPSTFFDGSYLRYLGWVLSDVNPGTRIEVVKVLSKLYMNDEFVGGLRHFTERFKPRIIEMATSEVDLHIRIAAIGLANKIRNRGFLEDDEIETLLISVFDHEVKVRDAAKEILHGCLEEKESELVDALGGEVADQGELKAGWLGLKVLVTTILAIQERHGGPDSLDVNGEAMLQLEHDTSLPRRVQVAAYSFLKGLNGADFESVAAYLLYDNDATNKLPGNSAARKMKQALLLDDEEECVLLEILNAAAFIANEDAREIRKAKEKEQEEETVAERIADCIPKLLTRFPATSKIARVLALFEFLDVSIYSKLRQTIQFEALLDLLKKIFFGYSDNIVLRGLGGALLKILSENSMETTCAPKIIEFQDDAASALLDPPDTANTKTVEMCLKRIDILLNVTDCTLAFEDFDATGQSVYIKLIDLLTVSEESLKQLSRNCLRSYFMWKIKHITETPYGLEMKDVQGLLSKRDEVLYILDAQVEKGQDREEVARLVLDFEVMFLALGSIEGFDAKPLERMLDATVQRTMIQAFKKAARRYARFTDRKLNLSLPSPFPTSSPTSTSHTRPSHTQDEEDDSETPDNESESGTHDDERSNISPKTEEDKLQESIRAELQICQISATLVRAWHAKKMDQRYIALLAQNKGRLGFSFDAILVECESLMPGVALAGGAGGGARPSRASKAAKASKTSKKGVAKTGKKGAAKTGGGQGGKKKVVEKRRNMIGLVSDPDVLMGEEGDDIEEDD